MRRKMAAGNWKMNGSAAALAEIEAMKSAAAGSVDVLICPPATLISQAANISGDIAIGGMAADQMLQRRAGLDAQPAGALGTGGDTLIGQALIAVILAARRDRRRHVDNFQHRRR